MGHAKGGLAQLDGASRVYTLWLYAFYSKLLSLQTFDASAACILSRILHSLCPGSDFGTAYEASDLYCS